MARMIPLKIPLKALVHNQFSFSKLIPSIFKGPPTRSSRTQTFVAFGRIRAGKWKILCLLLLIIKIHRAWSMSCDSLGTLLFTNSVGSSNIELRLWVFECLESTLCSNVRSCRSSRFRILLEIGLSSTVLRSVEYESSKSIKFMIPIDHVWISHYQCDTIVVIGNGRCLMALLWSQWLNLESKFWTVTLATDSRAVLFYFVKFTRMQVIKFIHWNGSPDDLW